MTYSTEKTKLGKIPVSIVEIDLDQCSLTYGTSPCTASGAAGSECFNTRQTCQDSANYTKDSTDKTHTFKSKENNDPAIEGIPTLEKISSAPTKIVLGKGLGYRAKVTITLTDFTHHDRGVDPYVSTRTYNPEDQGTYFTKLKARNPFYAGRTIRIKTGYENSDLVNDFITRQYVIDSMSGPDGKGQFTIVAKDPLKLADNERSQCPDVSTGALSTAYTAGDSTIVLGTGEGAQYGTSGEVRINDNILSFTGVSTDTLTGVTGGEWGSTDANAEIGDKVQLCKSWSSENVVDIISELLTDFTDVSSSFINTTDWDNERDKYLSTTKLTAIISEPTGVQELIEELTEQFLIDVWWSDTEQEIKLSSIIPKAINTSEAEYNDESHIKNTLVKVSENVKDRVTQVWFFYAPIDHSQGFDSDNMQKVKITIDADAESDNKYGDKRIKKIYSRWTDSASLAIQSSGRLLGRDSKNRKQISFCLDVKDDDLKTGDHFLINTKYISDQFGARKQTRMQVLSHDEIKAGTIQYDTIEVNFSGRYFFIAPNSTPDYSSATEEQKSSYGFISPNSGNFSDGGGPYKII